MELYVGTSGYAYPQWKGSFYPEHLSERSFLSYYGEHFGSVEINNTFYRMPKSSVLAGWGAEVPASFRFALKAPQRITHFQRLLDCDDAVSYLLEVSAVLGARLGPILFQLPPAMKKDLARLRDFLALFPPQQRIAMEFRHPSWLDEEVFTVLHEHRCALCVAQGVGDLEVPLVATAQWGYLRLRRPDYAEADLAAWGERVQAQDWREVYVYFKHEDSARAPQLARRFLELAGGR